MIKDGKRETWIYLTIDWIIARPQSYRTESLLIFHWEPMGRNPIYRSSSVGYFYSQKTSSTVQHNVYCLHHHFRLSTPCSYCFFFLFLFSECVCFFQPACCLFDKQPDAVTMMTQKDAERSSSWQDEISQMRSGSAAFPCFWSRPLSFYIAMYSITSSFSWDSRCSFPFCSSRREPSRQ